jgi:ketosteroid isomerase-like protein
MKHLLLFTLLIVLPFAAQAQSNGKKSAADAKAEQEIRQDLVKQQEASLKRDADFYDKLYAPEYFQVTNTGQIRTKAEFLEGMRKNTNEVKLDKYFFEDVKIRMYGNTAIIDFIIVSQGHNKMGEFNTRGRATSVRVKMDGRWRVVSSHTISIVG